MKNPIKAPTVGESITEVRISKWMKNPGQAVKAGDIILEIESDKATVEVASDFTGALEVVHQVGDTVKVGELIGYIDDSIAGTAGASAAAPSPSASAPSAAAPRAEVATRPSAGGTASATLSPAVRRVVDEEGLDPSKIQGTGKGGRITKGDALEARGGSASSSGVGAGAGMTSGSAGTGTSAATARTSVPSPQQSTSANAGRERRVQMSLLRQKIAERLVMAQRTAAILTTFNECDMTAVMDIRKKHKESFQQQHGVSLSFMSFFTRAVVEALKAVPAVNAMIDGKEIVYRDYYDVGIAVGTERGLVVPVMRDVGSASFPEIEKILGALAVRAREGKLSIQELTGGTFTISNGGTYGSLLSTPILNPPQSGILGMHKIQERPMAVNGQVLVRPMMYLALSYDHRIIDGKEAVTFLIKVKEGIENPKLIGWDH